MTNNTPYLKPIVLRHELVLPSKYNVSPIPLHIKLVNYGYRSGNGCWEFELRILLEKPFLNLKKGLWYEAIFMPVRGEVAETPTGWIKQMLDGLLYDAELNVSTGSKYDLANGISFWVSSRDDIDNPFELDLD